MKTISIPAHPDRTGSWKTNGPNRLIVLHTSEQREDSNPHDDAETLAMYIASPGDRPSTSRPGSFFGASYHAIFDTDQVIVCAPDNLVTYSAGGANAFGVHGCFPGKAGRTRNQWLQPAARAQIRQCAEWCVEVSKRNGIPLLRPTPDQIAAGAFGVCDHHDVSLAFRKSTHTDVGDGFPWDALWRDIDDVLANLNPQPTPEKEPDMQTYPIPHKQFANTVNWPGVKPTAGVVHRFGINVDDVPEDAKAAFITITVTNPSVPGHVLIGGPGEINNDAAVLAYGAAQRESGSALVRLDQRQFDILLSAPAHVICSVTGYVK